MEITVYIVDAFTLEGNIPFSGNPAAVCLLSSDDTISDTRKQQICSELNLSTTFVSSSWTKDTKSNNPLKKTIRFFIPTNEIPICGHATLASAKVIFSLVEKELGANNTISTIEFETQTKGTLNVAMTWTSSLITLTLPANHTIAFPKECDVANCQWLGKLIMHTLGPNLSSDVIADIRYSPSTKILMLRLNDKSKGSLEAVKPNFQGMLDTDVNQLISGISVTIKGEGDNENKPHFYSRFFAPWNNNNEDPVCGVAHTVITTYWMNELSKSKTLHARQKSARQGDLYCELVGDYVRLSGEARITLKGSLYC